MSATVPIVGRLTADAELRYSASGTAVARFTVVSSRRTKNQNTQEWEDVDVTYWDCVAFKQLAENCVESLVKGTEVVLVGRAKQESWEDRQTGQKRSKISVVVEHIGPSLRAATAKVSKAGSGGGGRQESRQGRGGAQRVPEGDPWASGAPQGGGGGWGGDEPPF
ncbi:single-strand binding protein [Streptomyces himastatinicus ATCC 53653]|uniref:Single-stranded DNA-binding protein n=1 Tax=Streptomyces himastatinicus ATCC 53653 TaxID=457427 RepID=D9WWZ7_9ACTN|nr:single-stranded DNA-binding protein [Streptomyces himastatinicus]EFL29425.1 single-strand binding protein [Streptomyces himastatinicus ATCC 53653]